MLAILRINAKKLEEKVQVEPKKKKPRPSRAKKFLPEPKANAKPTGKA